MSFSNDKKAVKLLTDYMHGHRVKVTDDVLLEVLSLADMLQVDEVKNYCIDLIPNISLNIENCLQILKLCSLYNIEHPEIDKFIRGNLIELSQMEDMLCITMDSLDILLTDEELSYWPMDDRFVFISVWCNAQEDRLVYFETLFKRLDLNKIDRDIIEVVIKKDVLVSRSKLCLHLINNHLCDRKDKPVPFVFVLNVRRLGSNVLGFNLEDEKLYQFRFPDQIVDSPLLTVAESGHTLSIKQTPRKTYLYVYDVNTNNCTEKMLQIREDLLDTSHIFGAHKRLVAIPDISYILDAHGRLILITNKPMDLFYPRRRKPSSELYHQVSDDGKSIQIEPILTLSFNVAGACFSQSMIIMSATTFAKSNKLFIFHLETNKFTVTDLRISHINSIIPFKTKLFLASRYTSCIVDLVTYSTECIIKNELDIKFPISTRYVFLSKSIIGIDHNCIKILNVENEKDCTHAFHLERLKLDYHNKVAYGYLDRKRPLCHIMCPHCDPNAWEKEEEEKRRKTQFIESLSYFDYVWNDSNDDYDGYSDNDWNRPELIWDGSADEFVEAWW